MHSIIWDVSVHFQRSRVGFCEAKAGVQAIWMPVAMISLQ